MNIETESKDAIAFVYLLSDGDEKNKCYLTGESIILIRKKRRFVFELGRVKKLYFSSKLFLLPLVLGGTFGPFSFIAIINNSFHPVFSLISFLLSILAFYLGIIGKKSFIIETENDKKEIFLPSISENMKHFARFTNDIINGQNKEDTLTFYLKISKERLKNFKQTRKLELDKNGEFAHLRDEMKESEDILFIPVNYKIPTIQIKFEKTITNKLKPKVFGFINADDKQILRHLQ